MRRVLLAEVGLIPVLQIEGLPGRAADVNHVEHVQQAAVIHVRVGDGDLPVQALEAREQAAQHAAHLLGIDGEAAVHEQQVVALAQDVGVAAAGRLDAGQRKAPGQRQRVDDRLEGRAPEARQHVGRSGDVFKGLERRLVALVQHLHDAVGVLHQRVGAVAVQVQLLRQAVGKFDVEHRVVQRALARVVVLHAHLAQLGHPIQKVADVLGPVDVQAHAEVLIGPAGFVGVDVGDVEVVAGDQLQHRQRRARYVRQHQLQQQQLRALVPALDVAQLLQSRRDDLQLVLGAGDVDEQRVCVHGLVVAGAGDVRAHAGDDAARLQKGPRFVRQAGDVCLSQFCFPIPLADCGGIPRISL